MFSFHKPRVYRSSEGCCICRAKSSSSRFTDSRKYENDSMKCFDLKEPRHGEICNACVLLVKRFKRLPVGSNRHWGHVVDARSGPGTKSLSKYKKYHYRDDMDMDPCTSSAERHTTANNKSSLIPEKFSKIFKKNKKTNKTNTNTSSSKKEIGAAKRKSSALNAAAWGSDNHSLPTTPDSLDSDYEDTPSSVAGTSMAGGSTIVQFQTQTRASSYRSRNNAASVIAAAATNRKRVPLKMGSKRRKCLPPLRYRQHIDDEQVQFFDDSEWQTRKSCCGTLYECAALGGAILLDMSHYKPCAEHTTNQQVAPQTPQTQLQQKTIIASMPAVVQLAPPPTNTNSTPVLKKHHLFYKRQSECFPQGDMSSANKFIKTDSVVPVNSSISHSTTATNIINASLMPATGIVAPPSASSCFTHMPRHSTAKITTISPTPPPPPSNPSTSQTALSKSHNFLHKIKADTGKIVKHSLEKLNTAVRIKPCDLQEMKHVIKTVDKSYVLAKPTTNVSIYQQPQLTTASLVGSAGSSPNSISSSSSSSASASTKFSDNSSDSGFDENLLDRKSASPLQEDTDKKMLTRPGLQTLFLASGIQVQGQHQNIVLTGNEVAAKILQNRKQHAALNMHHQQQLQQNMIHRSNNANATGVKIAQIVGGGIGAVTASGSHSKMRAIYNNNNTIQHENGITTIVPASSLAAQQAAVMQHSMAPSTVTITPAPSQHHHHHISISAATSKKLPATLIGGGSNNNSNHNQSNNINSVIAGTHLNTINNNVSSLNQKIILVKTATKYSNSNGGAIVTPIISHAAAVTATSVNAMNSLNSSVCKN